LDISTVDGFFLPAIIDRTKTKQAGLERIGQTTQCIRSANNKRLSAIYAKSKNPVGKKKNGWL